MKIRAAIFDIYKTLLDLSPPPSDAEARWETLCNKTFSAPARLSLATLEAACKKVIAREHAEAKSIGIASPEIFWPAVVEEVLPELSRLQKTARDEFLFQHAQLQRTVRLMNGAAEALNYFVAEKVLLGIASNSQPYTLRELESALTSANLSPTIFRNDLSFYSFDVGFSKPDPHVFRLLTARLQNHGISPGEILMVGDRLDNDIAPARAAGWQTWHCNGPASNDAGTWNQFLAKFVR